MKINEAIKKCKEKFINLDCVIGVGKGKKEGRETITILVSKRRLDVLRKIPQTFEGVEIEVKEVGDIKSQ